MRHLKLLAALLHGVSKSHKSSHKPDCSFYWELSGKIQRCVNDCLECSEEVTNWNLEPHDFNISSVDCMSNPSGFEKEIEDSGSKRNNSKHQGDCVLLNQISSLKNVPQVTNCISLINR